MRQAARLLLLLGSCCHGYIMQLLLLLNCHTSS
jgi:hypothetical protein